MKQALMEKNIYHIFIVYVLFILFYMNDAKAD